jgi:HSP20 family protein
MPSVNVYDAGSHFVVTAELPGVRPDQFELALTGGTLTLRGQRSLDEAIPDEAYRRQERPSGRWSRSIALPSRVDGERVRATLAHGVLTVELPKAEDVPTRQIPVHVAGE